MQFAIPDWIRHNEKSGEWELDPDKLYQKILDALGVKEPTRYWIRVVTSLARKLAQAAVPTHISALRILKRPQWRVDSFAPRQKLEHESLKDRVVEKHVNAALGKADDELARKDAKHYWPKVQHLARMQQVK